MAYLDEGISFFVEQLYFFHRRSEFCKISDYVNLSSVKTSLYKNIYVKIIEKNTEKYWGHTLPCLTQVLQVKRDDVSPSHLP